MFTKHAAGRDQIAARTTDLDCEGRSPLRLCLHLTPGCTLVSRRMRFNGAISASLAVLTAVGALAAAAPSAAAPAASDSPSAEPALSISADYTVDLAGPTAGSPTRAGRVLDNLKVDADADLDRIAGWKGGAFHLSLLSNSGGQPNDVAGTLEGVDNIEVARPRAKLYEAWIEQSLGPASLRVGLYDLNSEFYTTDAAGLLISPVFGIGSELAASGPNGPSIFPSTALAVRLRLAPTRDTYVQAAAIGARAGVLGDPGGVDFSFEDGLLYIAEAGWIGRGKVAVGGWRYSRRQAEFADLALSGQPLTHVATGAYLLVERPLRGAEGDVRAVTGFARVGVSEGETTPFRGGGQAGLLVTRVFESRPDSALSLGVNEGRLASDFRRGLDADGVVSAAAEYSAELTYADRLTKRITLQPSVQYIADPGGDRRARNVLFLALRARIHLN
ncbi:MAG: Carbohydrate-selective porin OprB [Caulobacteraceae bacterium]|nr:Carbohydrate-selective porin OprB [Caulobacteraceae bacterium]